MSRLRRRRLVASCACMAVVCLAVAGCGSDEEASRQAPGQPGSPERAAVTRRLRVYQVVDFVCGDTPDNLDEEAASWALARPYEKLAVAEALLPHLTSRSWYAPPTGAEQAQASAELSLAAGRAAWCLEQILGIRLPDVRPQSSSKELAALHAKASRAVESYRSEVMARAVQQRIPPAEFARLKRKYRGKVVPVAPYVSHDVVAEMDNLLGEWPPIGRKYEDLVIITGAKGQTWGKHAPGAVVYRLDMGHWGINCFFIVKDGIIRAVRREPFS